MRSHANQSNPLAERTHCFHGHDLATNLTYRGTRAVCRRCRELSNQRYRARLRAEELAFNESIGYRRPEGLSLSSVRKNIWG